ncbi:hypothetical protein H3H54_13015 [Brachybacterium sp. Z12]|uniref:hypothetical protein n=1 Tax=Brachybacterium sp. Z12 TaxID=2759167 RepID=UPI0018630015|nr:hypothetical protein [Brachybacterium sp. Z12]QNN82100.1 hypothetical protein H3H54_13015 [Brachybacterium sp. Z12]
MDRASTVIAVLLSLAGGLSVRHPVVGAVAAGTVLTLGLGNGPAHIGSGILASPSPSPPVRPAATSSPRSGWPPGT